MSSRDAWGGSGVNAVALLITSASSQLQASTSLCLRVFPDGQSPTVHSPHRTAAQENQPCPGTALDLCRGELVYKYPSSLMFCGTCSTWALWPPLQGMPQLSSVIRCLRTCPSFCQIAFPFPISLSCSFPGIHFQTTSSQTYT